jgi:hypothetical protein
MIRPILQHLATLTVLGWGRQNDATGKHAPVRSSHILPLKPLGSKDLTSLMEVLFSGV